MCLQHQPIINLVTYILQRHLSCFIVFERDERNIFVHLRRIIPTAKGCTALTKTIDRRAQQNSLH